MIRVLLVDKCSIFRLGLARALASDPAIALDAEPVQGRDIVEAVRNEPWDVIVLHVLRPAGGGLESLRRIRKERPKAPVLVISMYPEDFFGVQAIKLGAAGYLPGNCTPEELLTAVKRIASGGRYVTLTLAEKIANAVGGSNNAAPHELLSNRENEIFFMLIAGKRINEIAGELSLSPKTVSAHRTNILAKMGMKSNADLIYYAMRQNLADQALASNSS